MEKQRMFYKKSFAVLKILAIVLFGGLLTTMVACNTNTTMVDGDKTTTGINDISVSTITISSAGNLTIIDTLNGTLQMTATVLPVDATNALVSWSVIDGTGTGTVNSTGLVSAITNGVISVRATSVSNPSVSNTMNITISNQTDVNMDITLTDLIVDGNTVMGFTPLTGNYAMVISTGDTSTPTVEATKHTLESTVVIDAASDITSDLAEDRTTTITVTSEDESSSKIYTVRFDNSITPVNLGTANDFVILAKTGISTATSSIVTGNIGVSPVAATYITGFSLIMDSSGTFSGSSQLIGNAYASDYTSPTPSYLITAVEDMQIAYADAVGRAANYNELFSGDLSGKTLTTGVYKFGTGVLINTDVTLTGSATDVWIFQISGQLNLAEGIQIKLAGGALAENIFWVAADTVAIGVGSHFEGTILAMTNISMGTNASINGSLYSQTAVTLDACNINKK